MNRHRFQRLLATGATLLVFVVGPARGQWITFDPAQHIEQVLTVYNTLENVYYQFETLQNRIASSRRLYRETRDHIGSVLNGDFTWRDIGLILESLDTGAAAIQEALYASEAALEGFDDLFGTGLSERFVQTGEVCVAGQCMLVEERVIRRVNRKFGLAREAIGRSRAHYIQLGRVKEDLGLLTDEIEQAESVQAISEAQARLSMHLAEELAVQRRLQLDQYYLAAEREAEDIALRTEAMNSLLDYLEGQAALNTQSFLH